MTSRPPSRPRTLRRRADRAARKLADAREKLFHLEAGSSPERPIEVAAVSVIELRAKALGCIRCGGRTKVLDHAGVVTSAGARRRVHLRCERCHATFDVWLAITERLLS